MCWSTPKSDSVASGVTQSLTGSLGSIVADKSIRAKGGADKRDCEVLAINSLAQIPVEITPLNHEIAFYCNMVPDSGAMVTAIPAGQAKGIELYHTDVVLRNAGGTELKTLGVFEACIGLQTQSAMETIYVVQGLSHPLLSRSIMKELGLLHPKFPHHLTPPEKADKEASPSGIVQMLAVEECPPKAEPKRVRFRSPQGRTDTKVSMVIDGRRVRTEMSKKTKWTEPTCISESDMSDEEGEAHSMHGHPDPWESRKNHPMGRFHRAEETRQQSSAKPTPTQGAPAARRP
jgi:hypothetical protein